MDVSEVSLEAGFIPHDRREARGGVVAGHRWAGQDSNLGPTDYECRPKA
jgi:hypothetical protein